MRSDRLTQEQVDELNAIFRTSKRSKKKKHELVWESALDTCELGDYQIVPLTSSWALRQEGRAMRHCVGGYDEMCAQGRTRVFSIRDLMGNRVATMSLIFRDDNWRLEQIKGYANEEICQSEEVYYDGERTVTQIDVTDFHFIAYEIMRLYLKAWERDLLKLIFETVEAGGNMVCENNKRGNI